MKLFDFDTYNVWVIPSKVLAEAVIHPLIAPLYITDIGLYGKARHHYTERKSGCHQYILLYCVQGKGFVQANGQRHHISSNTVLVIPPGMSHAYGADKDDPWDIYWVHYTGTLAGHLTPKTPGGLYIASVPTSKLPQLVQLFQAIFSVFARGFSLNSLIHNSLALGYMLGILFFTHADAFAPGQRSTEVSGRHSQIMNKAILYMQTHVADDISMAELAKWLGVSKSQISFIFKSQTSYSPINFFINLKMQQACRYLESSNMPVQKVAAAVGYKDPYYFSRLFTKTMGLSPSAYRASKRE